MEVKKKIEGIIPEVAFNHVLLSANKVARESGIILSTDDATYEPVQEVVKAAPGATYGGNPAVPVKVGDIVVLDMKRFAKRRTTNSVQQDVDMTKEYHEVELPITVFRNKEYIHVQDRDIKYYWRLDG